MNRLLIALCFLAAGKTDTWNPVVSYIVLRQNSQLSDFAAAPRQIAREQLRLSPLLPRPFQNSAPNVYPRREHQNVEGDISGLSVQPTVREYQPKGQLFISRVVTEKIEQPFYKNSKMDQKGKTTEQNYTSMEDKIFFPENIPVTTSRIPAFTSNDTVPNFTERERDTTRKPIEGVNGTAFNTTEITSVDDRASFDGDPCPAGYVRVDGKCVEKDD
ncbi:uncharacterized protein ACR2FA_006913 [Aphomia sociella]